MRGTRGALLVSLVLSVVLALAPLASAIADEEPQRWPRTPIEHVIVVVGENHTFGNVFGAYQPPAEQTISNLLSNGIVKADGTPGPNFHRAAQQQARDVTVYQVAPPLNCWSWTSKSTLTTVQGGVRPRIAR